ncbi:uncharacterized protein LOC134236519 [Saccostrea cucullata]|uniref:uncharacterized protein LOC134236519 n=1 Tax=Saccostrea cuccullata TaxID=36930 RepID=UPI002ED3EDD9
MVSLQKTRLDLAVNALIIVVCYARAASDDGYCQEAVQTAVQVPRCPQNSVEAANAAANKNCEAKAQNQKCTNSSNFVYHCVINVFENATVEVCAPSKFIHGFCTEFNIQGGRIQPHYFRNCSGLKPPCPARYLSTDAYKYKGCYDLIRASNKTDRRKSTGKQTDVNEDKT